MNEFDRRWQACVARARQALGQEDGIEIEMPAGFAGRVVARCDLAGRPSLWGDWERLSLRALALVSVALLICVTLELGNQGSTRLAAPHIEETVTQVFWLL